MQAYAGVAIPFDPAFNQNEQIGPDRLRAGIATPNPPRGGCEQEKSQTRHDQQARDKINLMRPDFDHKEKEPPMGDINQNCLIGQIEPTIPA